MKMCGEMLSEKLALLEEFLEPLIQQGTDPEASISELKNLDSMSSVVDFQNCILFCDRGKYILLIDYFFCLQLPNNMVCSYSNHINYLIV